MRGNTLCDMGVDVTGAQGCAKTCAADVASDGCLPGMTRSGACRCAPAAECLSARLTAQMQHPLSCQNLQPDELLHIAVFSRMLPQAAQVLYCFHLRVSGSWHVSVLWDCRLEPGAVHT